MNRLRKHGFLLGLLAVVVATLADGSGMSASVGAWFRGNRVPDGIVALIFLLSGIMLEWEQLRDGLADIQGTLAALFLIFFAAPLVAAGFNTIPLRTEMTVGLSIVAVMPTTLSTGVIMTAAAGGNMAHALLITVTANCLAVVTVPFSLSVLLQFNPTAQGVLIDTGAVIAKIAGLVLLPIGTGWGIRRLMPVFRGGVLPWLGRVNLILVLWIVWIALAESRDHIHSGLASFFTASLLSFGFHGALLLIAFGLTAWLRIGAGRRESVVFMGGQKTLLLSVIIQGMVFPGWDGALMVCVVHHVVHLVMDSYLVGRLRPVRRQGKPV